MSQTEQNKPLSEKEQRSLRRVFLSSFLFAGIAAVGVLLVLYAWRLPPFASDIESTENALVRGQVTLISPQVSGYVTDVPVQDFQHVQKGDLLVKIDERIYLQKVAQAKAQLAEREAALANNEQQKLTAEAVIRQNEAAVVNADAQSAKTEKDYQRAAVLAESGASSQSTRDSARAARAQNDAQGRQVRASLEIAREDLKSVMISRASLEAAVESAQAALALAQIDLDNTQITAPADGQLGQVSVRLGAYVTAGTQLMGLVPDHLWVIANMKETQMARVRVGQTATFSVDALDGLVFRAQVERISPATGSEFSVLPADNATGNFVKISQRIPVRLRLDDGQQGADRLKPGMSVIAHIDTASTPAPAAAAPR